MRSSSKLVASFAYSYVRGFEAIFAKLDCNCKERPRMDSTIEGALRFR